MSVPAHIERLRIASIRYSVARRAFDALREDEPVERWERRWLAYRDASKSLIRAFAEAVVR